MQRRRRMERRGGDEEDEEEAEIWNQGYRAHAAADEHHWEYIAHRDRQLRSTVLLQRSVRRYLNETYDREVAARTIQAFVRRRVLREERRREVEDRRRRRTHSGGDDERWQTADWDRRRENATIKPSTPRRRGGGGSARVGPEEEKFEEEDDDQADIMWGRRRSGSLWSVSSGGSDSAVSDWSFQNEAEVTHSTAPLSGSDVTLWSASMSSGGGRRRRGGRGAEEDADVPPLHYEVFLWHHKQHALELAPCPSSGFPFVLDSSSANVSLPGMWHVRDGDVLLSINDCSTHESELTFEEVEEVLDSGVRPAILHFRRSTHSEGRVREEEQAAGRRGPRRSCSGGDLRRSLSMSSVRGTGSGTLSSTRSDILRQRQRSEASLCYVIWREEVPALGIRFRQRLGKPYPEVETVRDDGAASGGGGQAAMLTPSVQPGDWLLSINDWGVRNAKFHHVLEVLHYSPRPLVLTFRRVQRERTFEL